MRKFLAISLLTAGLAAGVSAILALGLAPGPNAMASKIGAVIKVRPVADISSEGKTRAAKSGSPVHYKDMLTTGASARLEVNLADDTKITLGEKASLTIDEFVYNPAGRNAVSAAVKGAFRFTTGLIGKAKQKEVKIQTPIATLAVRGTDFWGGPIDGTYGVLVLKGEVSVTTAGGTAVLDQPGQGVTISAAGAAPSTPKTWSNERVARAVATISF
ncbi:MAG: FecR family protein [Methyloligellaceae bacterium]